jgi:hypothetical protein
MTNVWNNIPRLIAYAVYLILVTLFYQQWLYSIGPDFIGQVSIAHKYADGHFHEAINGWWSPLFNWILAIFLKAGFNDLVAFRMINIIAGIGIIHIVDKISRQFIHSSSYLLIAFAPIVAFYCLSSDSVDVLTIPLFLLFVLLLIKWNDKSSYNTAAWLGVIAALAYLARTYNLYYFALIYLLILLSIAVRFRSVPFIKFKSFILSAIVFILLSSAWGFAIQSKYGHFSFSTRARFTDKEIGYNQLTMPMSYRGLTAPPDNYSSSAWDDPVVFVEKDATQIPKTKHISQFIKATVWHNIKGFFQHHISVYQLILLLLLSPFLFKAYKKKLLWPFILTLLYPSGFLLFHNEDRYYWPVIIMLMLFIMVGYEVFFMEVSKKNFFRISAAIAIALLFSYRPFMRLKNESDPTFYKFYNALHENRQLQYLQSRRFASLNYKWDQGLYASYALGGTYYGETKPGATKEEIENELMEHDIDCVLVFNDAANKELLPEASAIISISNIGMKIYVLK